jgi:hypothetical protein
MSKVKIQVFVEVHTKKILDDISKRQSRSLSNSAGHLLDEMLKHRKVNQ